MAFDTAHWLHWLPHPGLPAGEAPYPKRWLALFAVSMGVFLIALDITVVGVTAPLLSQALGATATQMQWAFDAYTVTLAGFVVLGGGLAERYGRKGSVQLGMLLFALGAAVSAFAPTIGVLLLGRVISGLGAAVVFPTCLSIISTLFAPDERHRAVGIFATIAAVGLAAGPLLGGLVINSFWWGAAFLIAVPFALAAVVAVAVVVPPSRRPREAGLDGFGALLSVVGLGGIVFAVIEAPDRGWTQTVVLVPLAVGLVCAAGFIAWELRANAPLFDLRVFRDNRVVGGALALAVVYFTFNSSQLLLPQYLAYVLDMSSAQVGLTMVPFGMGLALLSAHGSRLVGRHGQRAMLVAALTLMACGMALLALLPVWGGIANVLTGAAIYGLGFGLIVAPATSTIMVAVPKEKAGDGSAVNMVSRQIGGAVGVAITGAVANVIYRAGLSLDDFQLTPAEASSVERSLSGVIALNKELGTATALRLDTMADTAMVKGVAAAMGVSAALALLVAVIGFFALRPRA
jgi:EmrB/QacA subfamily drug resistance transporter